jgi:ornithine lipid hydroxylase
MRPQYPLPRAGASPLQERVPPLSQSSDSNAIRVLQYLLWPAIFFGGLTAAGMAFEAAHPVFWFNVVYLTTVAIIALFERLLPYETSWLEPDGETFNNLAHTLLTKGLVQVAASLAASGPMLIAAHVQPISARFSTLWPDFLPLPVQVVLALIIAELGLYAAHRIAHERLYFWRFHALHHSVTRLWVINTGRFHLFDSLFKIALSQIPLYLLGAPLPVFLWVAAITAIAGLLTHCNIAMRTGLLDYVFVTPRLHRWHHSRNRREGNTNYCENIVLWDQVFGSYHNPDRPSPVDIGINGRVAPGFLGQLLQPFSRRGRQELMGRKPAPLPPVTQAAAPVEDQAAQM